MLKIASLGSVQRTDQGKSNSSISKSIKSSSNLLGNERDSKGINSFGDIKQINPNQDLNINFRFNGENFSDVRAFSSASSSTDLSDSVNNIWQNSSSAQINDSKIASTSANTETGTYADNTTPDLPGSNLAGDSGFIGHNGMGNGNGGFQGIPNDGNSDPLYDASKHTKEENKKISDMMTITNSSSSSETSKADAVNGEKFTKSFTDSILSGKSLQETIKMLDGKNLGGQTSQAYNTENMKGEISKDNKTNGTAIILRGSNHGVASMMAKDEENVTKAYKELGFDVKVVHSEKEFETALMDAREKAVTDKAEGKESTLATHVISHGFKAGGAGGHNNEDAYGGLAMQGGGQYMEKDVMGDIAGALEAGKDGESPFDHSYNTFTACHSGCMDNKQAFNENNGESDSKIADTKEEQKPLEQIA